MLHTANLQPSFYVIDVGDVLEAYHLDPVISQMFPQITLQGLIAIVMSAHDGPGHDESIILAVEKVLQEKFEILSPEDIQSIEQAALDICELIDFKSRAVSTFRNHGTAYFWKWLDFRTLVMAYHHDPFIQRQLQRTSIQAMEHYLYTAAEVLRF